MVEGLFCIQPNMVCILFFFFYQSVCLKALLEDNVVQRLWQIPPMLVVWIRFLVLAGKKQFVVGPRYQTG